MKREELEQRIAKAKRNVAAMEKGGYTDTVHHDFLAKFEKELEKMDKKSAPAKVEPEEDKE